MSTYFTSQFCKNKFEKFLDAIWPVRCIACDAISQTHIFCRHCEPSIQLAEENALFWFTGAIQETITKAKFEPSESRARKLMSYIREIPPPLFFSKLDGITFVPIHWRRRLKRGFDLSALFTLAFSKQLKLPIFDYLKNTRFDKPLTLSHSKIERQALTQNRYQLRKNTNTPKNILLLDDVMTTGATLESAKRVLETAGHRVKCFALAKTPLKI